MARNTVKHGPLPKAKKDKKKVVPRKQLKEKPPRKKKTEYQIQNVTLLKEAKTRVSTLQSVLTGIRSQVEAERAGGLLDPFVLQAEIERAKTEWERLQSELTQAKGLSRKRKDEIDEWKAWYGRLSSAEQPAGLERLQAEIKWRADELDSNAETINQLIPQELHARGVFEMAKQKQAAFLAGVHNRPVEEDPRLKRVGVELEKAVAFVNQLEPGRQKKKSGGNHGSS